MNPANIGRKLPHGGILKNVATNICGSDQHMVRGRTTAPEGLVLGHEITGEVVEVGPASSSSRSAISCSVPFNISCGRCRNCKEGKTGICLNVNPDRPGSAYGYVDMGGWVGGQAQYVLVPYADWNLLKFPDKDQAMAKILDLAMLSDIFPTGYHGCVSAGVGTGSTVYIAGAGPVGLAAAACAQLLGAAVVIVGDLNPDRLEQAAASAARPSTSPRGTRRTRSSRSSACPRSTAASTRSASRPAGTARLRHGAAGHGAQLADGHHRAGGALGIPGLYVTGDPGAADEAAKVGCCRSASASAGPSRTRSPPASAR